MEENIYLVTSHCDNDYKLHLLKDTVKKLHSLNKKVCIYSSVNITDDIINNVEHYIYNDKNPLDINHFFVCWMTTVVPTSDNEYFKLTQSHQDHGYAHLYQIKTAFNELKDKYKVIHIINYDVIFDQFLISSSEEIMKNSNGFFPLYTNEEIIIVYFSLRSDKYDNIINNISVESYLSMDDEKLPHNYITENFLTVDNIFTPIIETDIIKHKSDMCFPEYKNLCKIHGNISGDDLTIIFFDLKKIIEVRLQGELMRLYPGTTHKITSKVGNKINFTINGKEIEEGLINKFNLSKIEII